jgi:hypothetical protein
MFDLCTARALQTHAPLTDGDTVYPSIYPYEHPRQFSVQYRDQRFMDWFAIAASLVKLSEGFTFLWLGERTLAAATSAVWTFFFLAAILLQNLMISRDDLYFDQGATYVDIVTGQMPTSHSPGRDGKIVLGMPLNPKRGPIWRAIWALGGLVSAASLVGLYFALSSQPQQNAFIWASFQLVWLVFRSIYYHFSYQPDAGHFPSTEINPLYRPPHLNERMLVLVSGLSKYQILNHPRSSVRGPWYYLEDIESNPKVLDIMRHAAWEISPFLLSSSEMMAGRAEVGSVIDIKILAVIGDTFLASAAWIQKSNLTPMDLYDSVIFQVQISSTKRLVPAARALGRVRSIIDASSVEKASESKIIQKGAGNDGKTVCWMVWIPLAENRWAYFRSSAEDVTLFNKEIHVTVIDGEDVTRKIDYGSLGISFQSLRDVQDAVDKAVIAGNAVQELFRSKY